MKADELINFKALARVLTGNDNGIRRNKIPKKYKENIQELEAMINYWLSKQSK